MYSRVGIHVPNKNSKEEYSIRDFDSIYSSQIKVLKVVLNEHYMATMFTLITYKFLSGEEITNDQFSKALFKSYIAYMLHERGLTLLLQM